jgi:hypothetical protein
MITYTSLNNQLKTIPDISGSRFGRLVVLSYSGRSQGKSRKDHLWKCLCDCGGIKIALFRSLKRGLSQSCGCLQREIASICGAQHPNYRSGKTRDANGYIVISSKMNGQYLKREHRAKMEEHLGRELLSSEVVHHRNGDKADNRIENLQVMSRSEHARLHHGH